MILPLFGTLQLSLFRNIDQKQVFVGLDNFRALFGDPHWSGAFWNAFKNNVWFSLIHMLVQNPIGILLAALLSSNKLRFRAFYRTAIFVPTILSFRDRRLRVEADPVAALGNCTDAAQGGWPAQPLPSVARCSGHGADHGCADLGLAVRRHSHDADLCRAPVDP
jgi:hypothetical protein